MRTAERGKFCYFNPRSRGGSDVQSIMYRYDAYISIHAPAGGATAVIDKMPLCDPCIFSVYGEWAPLMCS